LDPTKSKPDDTLDTCIHEVSHALQYLLVGFTPNWITIIPGPTHSGLTSHPYTVLFDTGFNWEDAWKVWLKVNYSGLVGSAFLTGAYMRHRAKTDLNLAEEVVRQYGLTHAQDLDAWVECHRDIEANWPLIEAMARDLQEQKILSSEYFENFLLSR